MAFTTRSPRILVLVTLLASMTRHVVHGCRCVRVAPNERADYIRESDWIDLYAIATFANETSDDYSDYQDTVFVLKEVVYNTDPNGELPGVIEVDPSGEMYWEVSTYIGCCICGLSFPREDLGKDFLLPIKTKRMRPGGFGFRTCDIICKTEDESCAELAEDLRNGNGVAISNA